MSFRNSLARSSRAVSTLIVTTSKSLEPSSPCKRSSVGISSRHGTHQVAQRLTSVTRPLNAARLVGLPSGPRKSRAIIGWACFGEVAAATAPFSSCATRPSTASESGQRLGPFLPAGAIIPYTTPAATSRSPPEIRKVRVLRGAGRVVCSVIDRGSGVGS